VGHISMLLMVADARQARFSPLATQQQSASRRFEVTQQCSCRCFQLAADGMPLHYLWVTG
jgi:hypothetical protein